MRASDSCSDRLQRYRLRTFGEQQITSGIKSQCPAFIGRQPFTVY